MNPSAWGMISSYIWLHVPLQPFSVMLLLSGKAVVVVGGLGWWGGGGVIFIILCTNHVIIQPQIKDACFNPKHLNNTFSGGGTRSNNQMRWSVSSFFLMTRLDGACSGFFLQIKAALRWSILSSSLPTLWQHTHRHHLGNKYSSLNIVTIVKHVTSPLWCNAATGLSSAVGAGDETDYSLCWYSQTPSAWHSPA